MAEESLNVWEEVDEEENSEKPETAPICLPSCNWKTSRGWGWELLQVKNWNFGRARPMTAYRVFDWH
jgi:hypothetical protein